MGQHTRNPRVEEARRGLLPPKPRKSVALAAWSAIAAMFMPSQEQTPRHLRTAPSEELRGRALQRRRQRLARRAIAFKLSRMSHLYPPQSGSRRPEFSSAIPGQWSAKNAAT